MFGPNHRRNRPRASCQGYVQPDFKTLEVCRLGSVAMLYWRWVRLWAEKLVFVTALAGRAQMCHANFSAVPRRAG